MEPRFWKRHTIGIFVFNHWLFSSATGRETGTSRLESVAENTIWRRPKSTDATPGEDVDFRAARGGRSRLDALDSLEVGRNPLQERTVLRPLEHLDQEVAAGTQGPDGEREGRVRELEGALIRLIAYTSLTGTEINLSVAQQVLKNVLESQDRRVTIESIQKRVAEHYGLRPQDLKLRSNSKAIAFPRQVSMYLVKHLTSASLPEIGRQFGGKHHTTVLHSINKIESQRRTDKELNRTLNRLLDSLG